MCALAPDSGDGYMDGMEEGVRAGIAATATAALYFISADGEKGRMGMPGVVRDERDIYRRTRVEGEKNL